MKYREGKHFIVILWMERADGKVDRCEERRIRKEKIFFIPSPPPIPSIHTLHVGTEYQPLLCLEPKGNYDGVGVAEGAQATKSCLGFNPACFPRALKASSLSSEATSQR